MNRMKQLRKELGLTQAQVAQKLNVSQRALSNWEIGKHMPDKDSLFALADFYKTSIDYMLGYKGATPGTPDRLLDEYIQATFHKKVTVKLVYAVHEAVKKIVEAAIALDDQS